MASQTKPFDFRYREAKRNLESIREESVKIRREIEGRQALVEQGWRELEEILGRPLPRP